MSNIRIQEQEHLNYLINLIDEKLRAISDGVKTYNRNIIEDKRSLWANIYELDPAEIANAHMEINKSINIGDNLVKQKLMLEQMIKRPFFARIDFKCDGDDEVDEVYIGIGTFFDEKKFKILIYDWRSPIATMFYDFEVGRACYQAPRKKISGDLLAKRQYKISNGELEYVIESSVNIDDEMLQRYLAQNSGGVMHNIVASIQREQNDVIRNTKNSVVILQGVAGSGKTSIALHRAAYLLYKFKDTISSRNILIVSPNKVFASYISMVLPELGEENILECEMNQIVENELPSRYMTESQFEHLKRIIDGSDKEYISRTTFKSTTKFVDLLKAFVNSKIQEMFKPLDINFGKWSVSKEYLKARYDNYQRYTPFERIERIIDELKYMAEGNDCRIIGLKVRKILHDMLDYTNPVMLYGEFFDSLDMRDMFCVSKNTIEYLDSFAIAYIKVMIEGMKPFEYVKHIIIDEMQDYPPICYEFISKAFPCNKTILGDSSQSLDGNCATTAEKIAEVFPGAAVVKLNKSYRSTYEIMEFAKKIIDNKTVDSMERHGENVDVIECFDMLDNILCAIKDFRESERKTFAVICKTEEQAKKLYQKLSGNTEISLLTQDSVYGEQDVVITSVQVSKGLEFDQVVIPDCDCHNYQTNTDRNLLYVACTRALHKLQLLHDLKKTPFIP